MKLEASAGMQFSSPRLGLHPVVAFALCEPKPLYSPAPLSSLFREGHSPLSLDESRVLFQPSPIDSFKMPTKTTSNMDQPSPGGRERRQHPRVSAEWPISIALAEGLYEARLRDISAAGVCFYLDRRIPEMTVLELSFKLPSGGEELNVRGAVVRCEPISQMIDHFEVAVFLHELNAKERAAIQTYIESLEN